MKVVVAGQDQSAELAPLLTERARRLVGREHAPRMLDEVFSSLSMRAARNESELLDRLIQLLWHKTGVATVGYYMPRRPGPRGMVGAAVRKVLWKVLRYQHDRIAYQQNMINTQLTVAIEFMHEQHKLQMDTLRREIAELTARRDGAAT